ncbi:uncharacterized protein BDW70DRAFT_157922 [Aspergillus foveolatus]|uniref:uncharacterized protein n=1 Tax=Aspergillus foveolatus TaxID=210207 RepID=UPI003CCD0EB7
MSSTTETDAADKSAVSKKDAVSSFECLQNILDDVIDFAAVAQQCNITTSGAAYVSRPHKALISNLSPEEEETELKCDSAKRYQRLLKAHREGKVTAGDNGASAGTGPSEVDQGQTQTQIQIQTASGAAKKGRKRKEPAPKEDGNGDEPAAKRKRGRPPKAKAPTEIAAEEGENGTSKEETDQASNTHRAFGEDETMDEDDEA